MKKVLVVLVCVAFVMIFSAGAKGQESEAKPKPKPKPCQYTGVIIEKLDKRERILTIETEPSRKEIYSFYFKPGEKQGCSSWQDLAEGKTVAVTCEEKKDRLEVICVRVQEKPKTLPFRKVDPKKKDE